VKSNLKPILSSSIIKANILDNHKEFGNRGERKERRAWGYGIVTMTKNEPTKPLKTSRNP
jgi:hypothetical protein